MSARKKTLEPIDGLNVVGVTAVVTNTGDGLSAAMKTESRIFHTGDEGYICYKVVMKELRAVPVDKEDLGGDQLRCQVFRAETMTFIDEDLVAGLVRDQEERNLRAAEEAAGIARLPLGEDDAVKARVRMYLSSGAVKKADLQGLCDEHGIAYTTKDTALGLIELLADSAEAIKSVANAIGDGDE